MFLEDLDLSNQGITSLRGFDELQKFRRPSKVDLSSNPLTSLEHISSSNSLGSLCFDNTDITSFFGTKPQPALREVSFRNTPVSRAAFYRVACILAFGPKLKMIDGVPVTASERDAAFRFGADAAVAVSFGWLPPNTVDRSADEYAKIIRALHADHRKASKLAAVAAGTTASSSPSADGGTSTITSSSGNKEVVTLAAVAEKCMLYHHHHHHHGGGGSGAGGGATTAITRGTGSIGSSDDAQTIISLRARIAELEATVQQLKSSSTLTSPAELKQTQVFKEPAAFTTTTTTAEGDGDKSNNGATQESKKEGIVTPSSSSSAILRPMRVPGLMPSELETVDSVTWAAPTTVMYSFVTGGSAAVAMMMMMSNNSNSNNNGGDGNSSSGMMMKVPPSIALTLTRQTLEIQKLMSRQVLFRQSLSLLASVQAAEVGSTSSSSSSSSSSRAAAAAGPFKTSASLQLHFSDGCSALILFASKTAMNTVFKALKYRCCTVSKSISFSLDADVESLVEFIAPKRTEEELVDLFTKAQQQQLVVTSAATSPFAVGSGGSSNASPILPQFLPPKGAAAGAAGGSGGISVVRTNEAPGGGGSSAKGADSARPLSGSGRIPVSPGRRSTATSGDDSEFVIDSRNQSRTESAQPSPRDDKKGDASKKGDEGDNKKNGDGDRDEEEEEEEEEEEKPRGGLRGPGGMRLVIPTGIKVGGGGRTPNSLTPGGGNTPQSTTPASIGVDGAWKGRKIIAKAPVKDSDEDSDDDSDDDD